MHISLTGISLIEENEGLSLTVYLDITGLQHIGYGHKLLPHESFPSGITQSEALQILQHDLVPVEAAINKLAPTVNQSQYDALCDFAFNLGIGSLTTMLSHGLDQVPTQILRWDHDNGKVIPGLSARRQKDVQLWNS